MIHRTLPLIPLTHAHIQCSACRQSPQLQSKRIANTSDVVDTLSLSLKHAQRESRGDWRQSPDSRTCLPPHPIPHLVFLSLLFYFFLNERSCRAALIQSVSPPERERERRGEEEEELEDMEWEREEE